MATTTTNLKLTKPATDDFVDISVINQNMDKIDRAVASAASIIPVVAVNFGTVTTLPATVQSDKVTSDMAVIGYWIDTPKNIASDITVSTANGSVTIKGTLRGSTAFYVYLARQESN